MMKLIRITCFALIFMLGTEAAWVQLWEDQFNGPALNDAEWNYEEICDGAGNNELECYTSHRTQNVRTENGNLVIQANIEDYQGKQFTSGRLTSKRAWAYGKFEARAKMPKGKHLWPAIWMLPQTNVYGGWAASGEIDIVEYRGDNPDVIMGTIHYGGSWPNNIYSGSGDKNYPIDFSADFHTFGVEWNQNEIIWFLDGNEYHRENINRDMWSGIGTNPYTQNRQPFDKPFHWILNVAVGGNFFGSGPYVTTDEARNWPKSTMEVDYVRVWQWI